MKRLSGNIYDLPRELTGEEWFEPIASGSGQTRIERIISTGQSSPEEFWYDQDQAEFVMLLQGQATLAFSDGEEVELNPGDWILVPARDRHRVVSTTSKPPCVWLAVHGPLEAIDGDA